MWPRSLQAKSKRDQGFENWILIMNDPKATGARLARAHLSLEGLSIGDALGQCFFSPWIRDCCLSKQIAPDGPWRWTDDTAMALGIVEVLERHDRIDQDELASNFAQRYVVDPDRGYGPAQHDLLRAIHRGHKWQTKARELFNGAGSFGNGGAMRAAPVGAYFADDMSQVVEQSGLSAEVTHAHPDGQAGAIAVAVAAAWAWNWGETGKTTDRTDLLRTALDLTPRGATRRGIELALTFPLDEWEFTVANELGDGSNITSADTVPFCLWVAAKHLDSFPEAIWTAIRVQGDIDTNCAIIGGIVAMSQGETGIPAGWRNSRERLISHVRRSV
jgi:ADP-ribosylglycohydrolase